MWCSLVAVGGEASVGVAKCSLACWVESFSADRKDINRFLCCVLSIDLILSSKSSIFSGAPSGAAKPAHEVGVPVEVPAEVSEGVDPIPEDFDFPVCNFRFEDFFLDFCSCVCF